MSKASLDSTWALWEFQIVLKYPARFVLNRCVALIIEIPRKWRHGFPQSLKLCRGNCPKIKEKNSNKFIQFSTKKKKRKEKKRKRKKKRKNLAYPMLKIWLLVELSRRGGGATRKWKWRTSAYQKTKVGGIRCKISLKKGGSFDVGSKMQFQARICKFYVQITAKLVNFSKCARKFAICV